MGQVIEYGKGGIQKLEKNKFMKNKSSNKALRKANATKMDEFYTQLADIENELKHYKDQFHDKVVFCNNHVCFRCCWCNVWNYRK